MDRKLRKDTEKEDETVFVKIQKRDGKTIETDKFFANKEFIQRLDALIDEAFDMD